MNWDLNPRIGLEAMLTNGFGATPATGILTLPSENRLLYYAGARYTPSALDSPQRQLSKREHSLTIGGLTVNTALVPTEGTTQAWANIDNYGNIFGYLGHSLSNVFQLYIINVCAFHDIPTDYGKRNDLITTYMNNKEINTTS